MLFRKPWKVATGQGLQGCDLLTSVTRSTRTTINVWVQFYPILARFKKAEE